MPSVRGLETKYWPCDGMDAGAQGFSIKQTSDLESRSPELDFIKEIANLDSVKDSFQDEILIPWPRNKGLPQFHLGVSALRSFSIT